MLLREKVAIYGPIAFRPRSVKILGVVQVINWGVRSERWHMPRHIRSNLL